MAFFKLCAVIMLVSTVHGSPAKPAFWKGTSLDSSIEEMRSMCAEEDSIACLKFKFVNFLDTVLQKDNFKLSEDVEVSRNSYTANEVSSRSDISVEGKIEEYVKSHDVSFNLPVVGKVTLGARNLDSDELDFKVNFNNGVQEARKSKLKKIFIPIIVFVLLKAMTLVPLALGVLALKAWNALQLSFLSFVVSTGLAIFQLCKKLASDNAHPQITAHSAWEAPVVDHHFAARSSDAAQMAYSGYSQS